MVNVGRQMMLAVHVEQCPRPDFAFGELVAERLHPERFNQEEVETQLGAMLLHAMDEQIIRVQLVRHHQIINPRHARQYLAEKHGLSMAGDWVAGVRVLPRSLVALPFFRGAYCGTALENVSGRPSYLLMAVCA